MQELRAKHRAAIFSALLTLDKEQGGWDKVFQLLQQGRRAAQSAELSELAGQLEQGQSVMLDGLKKGGQFLPWELALLELGLETGDISTSYKRLRDHYLLQQRWANEMLRLLRWPMLVVFSVVALLLFWLFSQQQLGVGAVLLRLVLTAGGLYALVYLGKWLVHCFRSHGSPHWLLNALKSLPGLNRLLKLSQTYHYLENLNQCIEGGLGLNQALKLAALRVPDSYFYPDYEAVYQCVERGERLSQALASSGLLDGVMITPMEKNMALATANDAQQQITSAVHRAYISQLWFWGRCLPQVLYALLPLICGVLLLSY